MQARTILNFHFGADELLRLIPEPDSPQNSLDALDAIQERHTRKVSRPPEARSREAYRCFLQHAGNGLPEQLDVPRFARRLAWALTYHEEQTPECEEIITSPLLTDALAIIDRYPSAGALLGVFNALLHAWDTERVDLLRQFLGRHLPNYYGKRKLLRRIQRDAQWYVREYGPRQLATELIYQHIALHQVWEHTGLPDSTQSHAYFAAVGWAYTLHLLRRRLDRLALEDILLFLEIHDVDSTNKAILSTLIEHLGENADPELKLPIQAHALKQWGDPRITGGAARWYGISDRAAGIFRDWITREDLLFFFDVVAQTCHDPKFTYRKHFWLSYLSHISLCRPVLHREAERFFAGNHKALLYLQVREPAQLTGGTRAQHAFIIEMGEFTFVEFSTAGACYVYHKAKDLFALDQATYEMSELRNQEIAHHRQEHIGSERSYWQQQLGSWIEEHLGIRPTESHHIP